MHRGVQWVSARNGMRGLGAECGRRRGFWTGREGGRDRPERLQLIMAWGGMKTRVCTVIGRRGSACVGI